MKSYVLFGSWFTLFLLIILLCLMVQCHASFSQIILKKSRSKIQTLSSLLPSYLQRIFRIDLMRTRPRERRMICVPSLIPMQASDDPTKGLHPKPWNTPMDVSVLVEPARTTTQSSYDESWPSLSNDEATPTPSPRPPEPGAIRATPDELKTNVETKSSTANRNDKVVTATTTAPNEGVAPRADTPKLTDANRRPPMRNEGSPAAPTSKTNTLLSTGSAAPHNKLKLILSILAGSSIPNATVGKSPQPVQKGPPLKTQSMAADASTKASTAGRTKPTTPEKPLPKAHPHPDPGQSNLNLLASKPLTKPTIFNPPKLGPLNSLKISIDLANLLPEIFESNLLTLISATTGPDTPSSNPPMGAPTSDAMAHPEVGMTNVASLPSILPLRKIPAGPEIQMQFIGPHHATLLSAVQHLSIDASTTAARLAELVQNYTPYSDPIQASVLQADERMRALEEHLKNETSLRSPRGTRTSQSPIGDDPTRGSHPSHSLP